ncbi:MAG TPA: single-stranded-DNA-specific exonuclease RecJ, partial [Bacteroidales bacterium]|nr:single-stranded-DNA-specific exonuclease RecJ [Bacteroidales bacterium]
MEKKWIIKEAGDSVVMKQLMNSLDVPVALANLMVQHGITSYEEASSFFRPSLENLYDP